MPYHFDRREYRIPYPMARRAVLLLEQREVALVDCSERGLRYVADPGERPEVGSVVEGRVRLLSGGAPVEVSGTVVRIQSGEVAVQLLPPGIPVQRIFAEQRWLGRHYPARR